MGKKAKGLLKKAAVFLYRVLYLILPVKENMIVFNCSMGKNYTGNCRYIYEKMVEQGLDKTYRCIWFFCNPQISIPGKKKIVKYGRMQYLYYMAVAGIWVFDCRQPGFLKKKKKQKYIQTWHGTPLKKLALDMDDVFMANGESIGVYKEKFRKNAGTWDYLISQNPFSTKTFQRCFDFHKVMLEIGYPRNDWLISKNTEKEIVSLKKKWGLPSDKRIILYAPTWRDNEYDKSGKYKFSPKLDFSLLQEQLKDEYVMIVKYHYLVQDQIDWSPYRGFLYHFDEDITGMYLVSDLLITDYSSVMFDYSILKRPMFFYCYDLKNYKENLRGFYFNFEEEAPGPISETTERLITDIREYDGGAYREKYEKFREKYNPWDDGHASEKVVDLIRSF